MIYQIDIQNEIMVSKEAAEILKTAIVTTLQREAISTAALTVLLTNDEHLRQLNEIFRGLNKATDVLSFPAGDAFAEEGDEIPYIGDVAISIPTAGDQAQASGHLLIAELQLLAVHGVLHLLGYDHLSTEEKTQMWLVQAEILESLGLHDISPTET